MANKVDMRPQRSGTEKKGLDRRFDSKRKRKKSASCTTEAEHGSKPLDLHQPQKSLHFAW
ncbi:hypothetical protein E2C01_057331 [Portunus trituberculatus]|uniref:Uncharacterized protein n=1 Tax=Portunus trituberculatus TaxID=210409 RepID=A0A5B7H072_PORTR|nr:hypothetical protein [Portunus trituberculatus]